jgi:tRNA(His) 5'-end guanylyltransferase
MNLADRMKWYERSAGNMLMRRVPVIIRVDGKAFHTLTRGLDGFDPDITFAMDQIGRTLMEGCQGAKAAYVQSDEVSVFLRDYDSLQTEPWLGYVTAKLVSISASLATRNWQHNSPALFDSRAFNVPREDVVNYFVWRAKDWARNSLSIYCRQFFSAKELRGKKTQEQHEMLKCFTQSGRTGQTYRRDIEMAYCGFRLGLQLTYFLHMSHLIRD